MNTSVKIETWMKVGKRMPTNANGAPASTISNVTASATVPSIRVRGRGAFSATRAAATKQHHNNTPDQ
ncbi:MAG: hypothetical protein WDM89_19205 [Rhizomicrobium sp.]